MKEALALAGETVKLGLVCILEESQGSMIGLKKKEVALLKTLHLLG